MVSRRKSLRQWPESAYDAHRQFCCGCRSNAIPTPAPRFNAHRAPACVVRPSSVLQGVYKVDQVLFVDGLASSIKQMAPEKVSLGGCVDVQYKAGDTAVDLLVVFSTPRRRQRLYVRTPLLELLAQKQSRFCGVSIEVFTYLHRCRSCW